jgi:hypothetical protein
MPKPSWARRAFEKLSSEPLADLPHSEPLISSPNSAPTPYTLETVPWNGCRWPVEEHRFEGRPLHLFCGVHIMRGSYCEAHWKRRNATASELREGRREIVHLADDKPAEPEPSRLLAFAGDNF